MRIEDKIKKIHELDTFSDVSFFETDEQLIDKELNRLGFRKELPVLIEKRATKTSKGMLSKAWYGMGGDIVLAKGNTKNGLEPYAEFVGSRLVHYMTQGTSVLYDLNPAKLFPEVKTFNIEWVSVCKKLDQPSIQQFCSWLESEKGKEMSTSQVAQWIKLQSESYRKQIAVMLFTDAVIGNQDRHLNNWDVNTRTGELLPLLDFGASCLGWGFNGKLSYDNPMRISPDHSKPFAPQHNKQINQLKQILVKGEMIEVRNPRVVLEGTVRDLEDLIGESSYTKVVRGYLQNRIDHFFKKTSEWVKEV